jgi:hypothetical protein
MAPLATGFSSSAASFAAAAAATAAGPAAPAAHETVERQRMQHSGERERDGKRERRVDDCVPASRLLLLLWRSSNSSSSTTVGQFCMQDPHAEFK